MRTKAILVGVPLLLAAVSAKPSLGAGREIPSIVVQADRPGARINPAMWGIFFEDINLGADGGLYAEMVKNRSFEFPEALMGWIKISPSMAKGDVTVRDQDPFQVANPHYVRIRSEATAPLGVRNSGFRGMGVRAGEVYSFSAQVRGAAGSPRVTAELVANDGTTVASAKLEGISSSWGRIETRLESKETDPHASLYVMVAGPGTIDLDMVSLFPQKTWKGRPGGLRAEAAQLLADLKPGFVRFPGGCIVEGSDLAKRYQWKKTIGLVEERELLINRWNYESNHRPAPELQYTFQPYSLTVLRLAKAD